MLFLMQKDCLSENRRSVSDKFCALDNISYLYFMIIIDVNMTFNTLLWLLLITLLLKLSLKSNRHEDPPENAASQGVNLY